METRRHLKLAKQRAAYAERFGVKLASIDYWISRGKKAEDPPPLDEPERMADWWQRVMSGAVPERFHVAAASTSATGNGNDGAAAAALSGERFADAKGLDIEANVKALRRTLEINGRLLEEALMANDERVFNQRQRMYGDCFNLLRLAEQSLTELQKRRGQLVDRDQIETEATKVVEILRVMRESMPQRVLSHLGGSVPSELAEQLRQAIASEREAEDRIFRNLKLEGIAPKELIRLGLSRQKAEGDKENYE
jgi:hypothetical protein